MVKIAVIGTNEFIVGFQLAGIRDVIEASNNPINDMRNLKNRKDVGIVVADDSIMEKLEPQQRAEIEDSIEPVFIPVSAKIEHGSLRRLIKKSIGVDLWK